MPQTTPHIRKSSKPRANGRLTFIARHMGITMATLYKYRKGLWPQPYDYDERLAAAEAAWKKHSIQTKKATATTR